ncbi:MAG TPA: preprotein translocase subunit SecG [Bdellovibrionales bacterium]|nr:preprotein translocase subunit SecG [Bdellovibrionales bacterium]
MFTFVAVLHIIVAIGLIFMVLIQDSKSATGGMFGGGGSQSILGATGAATLFVKITRVLAVVFALTCIALTVFVARRSTSVLEGQVPPGGAPANAVAPASPPADAAPLATGMPAPGAEAKPAAPANQKPAEKPAENK